MLLLLNPLGQKLQILDGTCDLALGGIELVLLHQRRCPPETPAGAVGDGDDHRQIAQQFIGQRRWLRFDLLLCFEKQLRIIQNALPYLGGSIAPCGVEFMGLPSREPVLSKRIGHPLAIVGVDARHRYQIFHRDLGGDLPHANRLLNHLWEKFNQSQSPAHPTDAAIQSARQIVQAVGEALAEFL